MMKKFISIMMLCLVLTLPVSFAATLNPRVFGQDNIQGFIREEDSVTVITDVLGYANPQPSQLSIGGPITARTFNSCVGSSCSVTLQNQLTTSNSNTYTIRLLPTNDQAQVTANVDRVGATIQEASISPLVVGPLGSITLTARATDIASTTQGVCSGLKEIQVLDGSSIKKTIPLSGSCDQTITSTISVTDLTSSQGTISLTIRAVDRMNNAPANQRVVSFTLDKTAPVITASPFSLVANNMDITTYKDPIAVTLSIPKPTGAQVVRADLSTLNPSLGEEVLTCNEVCSKQLTLNLGTLGEGNRQINLKIIATDEVGNTATSNLRKSIRVDHTGPRITDVRGLSEVDGKKVLGTGKNFTVRFNDESPILPADIILTIGSTSSPAINCSSDLCTFKPSFNAAFDGTASISGKDILGNIATPLTFPAIVDVTPPSIISINQSFKKITLAFEQFALVRGASGSTGTGVTTPPPQGTDLSNYPIKGDIITITAVVNEPTAVFAYGDFSDINENGFFVGSCVGGKQVRDWDATLPNNESVRIQTRTGSTPIVCSFEVEITRSGHIVGAQVPLTFEDPAGNKVTENLDLPIIYGIADVDPNFWTHTIDCSPKALDRGVGRLIEQKMFCTVKLTPLVENVQMINTNLASSCKGQFLQSSRVGNRQTENPYIELTFAKNPFETNTFNVSCDLSITSLIDSEITITPELEKVSIPIELFNNPLGTPDDAVIKKIEDIKDTWGSGLGRTINILSALVRLSTALCKTIGSVTQVSQALGFAASADFTSSTVKVAEPANQQSDKLKAFGDKFCNFVNCRPTQDEGWTSMLSGGAFPQLKDTLSSLPGTDLITKAGGNPEDYVDVRNNIYLAAATLCVPGIIEGIEKYRQIQCFYGYCLQDLSLEAGIPADACEAQHAYQTCKYFVTPLFRLHPLVNFFDDWANKVKSAISDPFAAIGVAANLFCPTAEQTTWTACRLVHMVNVATDAYENVVNLFDSFKGFSNDYCKELDTSSRSRQRTSSSSGGGLVRGS